MIKKTIAAIAAITALSLGSFQAAQADTLKFGISMPLSGPGAAYGIGSTWVAKQAAERINKQGGIKAGGKTYTVEIIAYDNKYNAADGAKVAQTLINQDDVRFVVASGSTAAVSALQSISERQGVLVFTGAWGKRLKGKNFPMTFTNLNTPTEVLGPLYSYIKQTYPNAKTVALVNPNDSSGQDTEKDARATLEKLGFKVVSSDFFERSTTEFVPLATKVAANKPDIIELAATPPQSAGQILKELDVLGWKGIKINSAGSSSDAIVKAGGASAEGTYLGIAADYGGTLATPIQRELDALARKEINMPLDQTGMMSWESIMAIKKAIETADSVDPKKVAEVLPKIIFESSYGPSAFNYAEEYGLPNQMMLPILVTQIKAGKTVEVKRVNPPQLEARLKK
jgi:branched-chain amino acid transport system substrate-binding protein